MTRRLSRHRNELRLLPISPFKTMPLPQLLLALIAVFLLAVGQILFKLASTEFVWTASGLMRSLVNPRFAAAIAVYAIATLMWLAVLKAVPLRIAYPVAALAFFIVPVLAHYVLGESVGSNTYVGAIIIACGVLVSIYR